MFPKAGNKSILKYDYFLHGTYLVSPSLFCNIGLL